MSEITFRILDQRLEQITDEGLVIHLYGLTKENKSVYCKVLNYEPYCWLELPTRINWNGPKISVLKEYIQSRLPECPPDVMKFEIKKLAMYSVTRPFLRINFKTEDSIRHLKNLLRFTWRIEGFSKEFESNAFKLHEHNIPVLVKFGMERKIDMAGWVTAKVFKPNDPKYPKNYSYCDHSIYTTSKWVKRADIDGDTLVDPLICSFDIELHSVNRKSSSPAPDVPENVITMVSLCFGRLSQELEDWDTYVITLYAGDKEPTGKYKSTVINCKGSEKELLIEFTKLVKSKQPDIMTGYNINGFDWGALIKRAEINDVKSRFFRMGKLKWEKDYLKDDSWTSGARGKQEIVYVKMNGVFNFDMYPEIRFNHNLPMYKLGYVAERFLGTEEGKDDMPYQQMFALFEMIEILERSLENCEDIDVNTAKKLILSKVEKEELIEVDGMTNHVAEFYKDLKKSKSVKKVVKVAREYMLRLIKYVIQDARICPALMKFLNSLTSLWENANVSKCPPNYVYEKGQQIKVLAQYLEKAHWRNYVIPYYTKAKEEKKDDDDDDKKNYQGATVLKVKKGLYKDIAILDFKSLYPSIMITYNICHSTFRANDDTRVKDEDCHIAKWSEHIRCEHDPEYKNKKKRKGESVYCGDHKYRFIKQDGEKNKGLLPLLLEELLAERKRVKKQMFVYERKWEDLKLKMEGDGLSKEEKEEMILAYKKASVLDARQLAVKVSANSVRADTPIPCMINNKFYYKTIEQLGKYGTWKDDSDGNQVAEPIDNLKVWSDVGFTKVKYVFRHETAEKLKRVLTHTGCVDVTEDHSLLDVDGNEVTTKELSIGDDLMHEQVPLPEDTPKSPLFNTLSMKTIMEYELGVCTYKKINESLAWLFGLFFAEGTAGVWGAAPNIKSSWIIYNQDTQLLEKAKNILINEYENYNFKITKYYKSARVCHLKPEGDVMAFAKMYRQLFYSNRGIKTIPNKILRAPFKIRQAFFMGYYSGDGNRYMTTGVVVQNKGNIGTAQMVYLLKSLGYKTCLSYNKSNENGKSGNVYRIQCCTKFRNKKINSIKSIKTSPNIEPINNTIKDTVRNGSKIIVEDRICVYHNIEIHCERLPRQKLLDSLDAAQEKLSDRGKIVKYVTKTKTLTCRCHTCDIEWSILLYYAHHNADSRQDMCDCKIKYVEYDFIEYQKEKEKNYVYDIETKSHHFAAGVGDMIVHNSAYGFMGALTGYFPLVAGAASVTYYGRDSINKTISMVEANFPPAEVIYGDTDSVFVDFHNPNLKEAFKVAFEAGDYVTNQLPGVLELEMENFYSPLLLLTKKRYEYSIINDDGVVLKDGSKGSINKRRDNCDAARDIYTFTLKSVMSGQTQEETVYEINQQILQLFRGQVPLHNFVIYKGLKNTVEEYKNCAGHVLFAKRLEDRGNVLKAGTRLEYVFIKKYGKNMKSGDIMEDWSYFLMNRHSQDLHIDFGYYLEHNIMKPVTEVLNIAYPSTQHQFYKPEDSFKMAMDIYLKPSWAKMLRGHSLEKKSLYIAKYSKKKRLRDAAKTFAARSILDRLYKQHGLRKRKYHRPKMGQSHIFLNDKIIHQIAEYHHDWAEVKNQIKNRINLPEWIELRFS